MVNALISIIIPCRNEGTRILATLDDLKKQQVGESFEVVIADGSDDGTRELLERRAVEKTDPFSLRIIDNAQRTIPAALNKAVSATLGEIIIRIDAHARLETSYIQRMAHHLRSPGIDVVGPQIFATPASDSLSARVISWCQNTRLGNGGTAARNALSKPRRVSHSPMSSYRRSVWQQVSGYDEALLSNEDFDFDWRANRAGLTVWSVPQPTYRIIARSTLATLIHQRWRYGRWKAAVAWKHPASLTGRQIIPPIALVAAGVVTAMVASGFIAWIWLLVPIMILIMIVAVSLITSRLRDRNHPAHLAFPIYHLPMFLSYACIGYGIIHMCWAAGFLWGFLRGPVASQYVASQDASQGLDIVKSP